MFKIRYTASQWAPATALALALAAACAGSASAATFSEGFETVLPAGWSVVNDSSPVGGINWFQGNSGIFTAQAGTIASYAGANFNSAGAGTATISDWLITPVMTFSASSFLTFYTRTVDTPVFADRIEVRFSAGAAPNPGTTAAGVGTFTSLLLTVNPTLTAAGYPNAWTPFSVSVGVAAPTLGAIAFRYYVTNGGPDGVNSDYIGIDTVSITNITPVPEPATYALLALGMGAIALRRRALRS